MLPKDLQKYAQRWRKCLSAAQDFGRRVFCESKKEHVAMAQRTDCVMLNKGPYILQAIELLSTIFKDMELYQEKNVRLWPALERADIH